MIKNSIKAVSFCLVCFLVLNGVSCVLKFKHNDGIEKMELLYEQPSDSIDVLCLGSSHTDESINTGLLWDSWGIASYNLSGSIQPLWNTYYYLKEALKYQNPRLIVLDVYRVLEEQEYMDQSRIVKNTFGMKEGEDKFKAKRISAPEDELIEYVLEFPHYHSRYSDLSREDFLAHKGIKDRYAWKGFGIDFTTVSLPEDIDVSAVTERMPLPEKSEEYFNKIIELCEERDIPLVLVCAPYALSATDQQRFNTVADIAKSKGIPFLNYNLMHKESGISFTGPESCLAADLSHLNHRGNIKYSEHLGAYLKDNFDIPDRRDDETYSSWQVSADNTRALLEDNEIIETQRLSTWLKKVVSSKRLTAVLVLDGTIASNPDFGSEADALWRVGIDPSDIYDGAAMVLREGKPVYFSNEVACRWYEKKDAGTLMVERTPEGSIIEYGYDDYPVQVNGITVVLYDELTGRIVESSWWGAGSYEAKNVNGAVG